MKLATFTATCPYEIGDKVNHNDVIKEITDICCMHFVKTGLVDFVYELDDCGKYSFLFTGGD